MGKIHRELDSLRREIQRERATVNALKRQSKRIHGREVIYSSSESDAARIDLECGSVPDSPGAIKLILANHERILNEKRARAAELKDELDGRFPLTPCALFKLLTEGNPPNQRKRNRRHKRRRGRRR